MSRARRLLAGAAAGAAATTALNAATYVDMVVRGRPASSTPQDTVEKLSATLHLPVPGDGEARDSRIAGLGPLLGAAAGVSVGVVLGTLRSAGWRPPTPIAVLATAAAAMLAGNGPMAILGVTSPAEWSRSEWLSDIAPHLAYGVVATYVLQRWTER